MLGQMPKYASLRVPKAAKVIIAFAPMWCSYKWKWSRNCRRKSLAGSAKPLGKWSWKTTASPG
jgi:hypothetical protein